MADWSSTLDGLPGVSAAQKGKARIILMAKSEKEASLLVSGPPDVAAEAIIEILRMEGATTSVEGVEDQKLYKDVTVFMPTGLSDYVKRNYRMLTKTQFVAKMNSNRCCQVLPVEEQPSQLLALRDWADAAVDVDDVQLQDGMRLAVVAAGAEDVGPLQGWTEGRIAADEYQCAEWAVAYLAGDQGVKRWCFKMITGLVDYAEVQVEIDGMAFSVERVVLVERKPRIHLLFVHELDMKVQKLAWFVAAGMPNTAMLRDPATGLMKPLEVFLMADEWGDDPDKVAACAVLMEEYGITPLLPTGNGGYTQHDSCGRWPVDDSTRRRGQEYLTRLGRWPQRSGSGARMDASTGSGAGGASRPNSAVGIGRHASSQQAACSPAHPAHHLRVHDPFRATGGVGLRRSVAPVCRPLPLHPHPNPPRQHRSSMPSMRRL